MTNLQQLHEEEAKNLKKIAKDIEQLILEKSFNNRMGLSTVKEDVAIDSLSDLFNRNLSGLIDKAYQLGKQDMLKRVRKILPKEKAKEYDEYPYEKGKVFGWNWYKEETLKALDNLTNNYDKH